MRFVLAAGTIFALAACVSSKAPQTKPVVMTHFANSNVAIYDRSNGEVSYGEPKQLLAIRKSMPSLCAIAARDGGIQGLLPVRRPSLIQIDDYALVDGACGDPSLHVVLIERAFGNLSWVVDACASGRDARDAPLREILTGKDACWIVEESVDRMLQVRSGATPPYCKAHPQSDVLCPGYRYGAEDRRFIATLRRERY